MTVARARCCVVLAGVSLALVACGDDSPTAAEYPCGEAVSLMRDTVFVGEPSQITYTIRPSGNLAIECQTRVLGRIVKASTSDPEVASVTEALSVLGRRPGTAIITVDVGYQMRPFIDTLTVIAR
jgi:hypothetical protein